MKSIKFSDYIKVIKPNYVYLRLKPANHIRNNSTDKIAKVIPSLYKSFTQQIKADEHKAVKVLGKEFMIGTKYNFEVNSKVSYFVYIEKKKIEFYFIVPANCLSIIKERMTDAWGGITIEEVSAIPTFSDSAIQKQLVYKKEDGLSLEVNKTNNDLLRSNLNVVDVMEDGDKIGIFYNFLPTSQFSWPSAYRNTIEKVKRGIPTDRDKFDLWFAFKWLIAEVNSTLNGIAESFGSSKKKDESTSLLETALQRMNGGKEISESTKRKASSTIVNTQIALVSESKEKSREYNNMRSLVQSFDAISGDNYLIAKPLKKKIDYTALSIGGEINKTSAEECNNFIALPGRELLEQYDFIEKIETKETQVPEDLRKGKFRIGVNAYRGMQQLAYLSTDFEYQQLPLILIGPQRAGKSTLIGNLCYDAIKAGECTIIFDYIGNCELSGEVSELFSSDKILNIDCDNFSTMQGLGYNEVGMSDDADIQYDNAKKQTTQLTTLINSVNVDDSQLSARMERYLESASNAVFLLGGPIRDVFTVLQNHQVRHSYLNQIPKAQQENMEEYITALQELDELSKDGDLIGTKIHLVSGIIDRLNKLKKNTYLEKMLKKDTANNINLVTEMQKNQLICLRMPEVMFSTDGERDIYTTYWLTKIWMALQIRKAQLKDRKLFTKCNLIIDELYQVENTEKSLSKIISRLAKFGLKPIISCHYLNQIKYIREELRSANASYMLIAGCDKKNFHELSSELYPFEESDLLKLPRYHSMNLIKNKTGYARFITKLPKPVSVFGKQKRIKVKASIKSLVPYRRKPAL
jgi:ABC-type cobalamin transport system ATPase subunit